MNISLKALAFFAVTVLSPSDSIGIDSQTGLKATSSDSQATSTCPTITKPEKVLTHPKSRSDGRLYDDGKFGNSSIRTFLGTEIIFRPGGAGQVLADGSLSIKQMWWRYEKGKLRIEGRRLDQAAAPLRARIQDGFGDIGFQPTSLIFPSPGCWEVTAKVGEGWLIYTVLVKLVGDGP